jgi:hypothetical protein
VTSGTSINLVVGYGGAGSIVYGNFGATLEAGGSGSVGAVRVVWPGNSRRFPSTCVGTP